LILEGIVTTINENGSTNISPMGPEVNDPITNFQLKPFTTSTTFQNLTRRGEGVFHVTDDVLLLAQAAIGRIESVPRLVESNSPGRRILAQCCRWYAFAVEGMEAQEPRAVFHCRVVEQGRCRDFFGFNRAKHAVVEAAILATRIHLVPFAEINSEYNRLSILVQKTGGLQERAAFDLLRRYVLEVAGTDDDG
jgi:hypothetical protein